MSQDKQRILVSFKRSKDRLIALIHLEDFARADFDTEMVLAKAEYEYNNLISNMSHLFNDIKGFYRSHTPLPASLVWKVGNEMKTVEKKLEILGLVIENLYSHIERDVNIDRDLLTRAYTIRRYLSDSSNIPNDLTWRRCRRGTKRIAMEISNGTFSKS